MHSILHYPPQLMDALRDGDIFVRTASHRALMQIGQPAIEALLALLRSRDYPYRSTIAAVLAASVTPDAERFISKELQESILMETRFVRCLGEFCVQRASFPPYPSLARAARITGKVFLAFSLKDGNPAEIMTSGHPLLVQAAVNALNQYRFVPTNTRERYQMTMEFDLMGSSGEGGTTAYDFVFPNYIRTVARTLLLNTETHQ